MIMGRVNFTVLHSTEYEMPAIRHIWKTVFGNVEEENAFFNHYFDHGSCAVVKCENTPASAGHLFHVGDLVCGGSIYPCSMIYAVATLPQFRNRGFGAAVVRDLISFGRCADKSAVVLCPSDDSLFEYYSARTELHEFFYVMEQEYHNIPSNTADTTLSAVSADEYSRLRKNLLTGIPHISLNLRALSYQNILCGIYGGGMFRIETPEGTACAVVEKQSGGIICVKELLTPCGCVSTPLSSIALAFPADKYIVRTPAHRSDTGASIRRFGMLSAEITSSPSDFAPWLGLAFD